MKDLAGYARTGDGPRARSTWRATTSPVASPVPPIVEEVLGDAGSPIEPTVREDMERRLGFDFSTVRIHADSRAASATRAVDALAFTVGRRIVFGAGLYEPRTPAGRYLLSHELRHVVQQRHRRQSPDGVRIAAHNGGDEQDADRAGRAVASATSVDGSVPPLESTGPLLQRVGSGLDVASRIRGGEPLPYAEAVGHVPAGVTDPLGELTDHLGEGAGPSGEVTDPPVRLPAPPEPGTGVTLTPDRIAYLRRNPHVIAFYLRWQNAAREDQDRTSVPALATLAQMAVESSWGRAAPGYNFFGVTASTRVPPQRRQQLWTEEESSNPHRPTVVPGDPRPGSRPGRWRYRVQRWFRRYDSPAESIADHSHVLTGPSYAAAWRHTDDPVAFVRAVARGGYASGADYEAQVVNAIGRLNDAAAAVNEGLVPPQ